VSAIWIRSGGATGGAASGDVLLEPHGDLVRVGSVGVDETVEWVAEVDRSLLPDLPEAGEDPQPVDDADVRRAVDGILEAERNRGG
jgi:hypothetical protein